MTTIAWDGRYVAADTLAVNGHVTQAPVRKLKRSKCDRYVYAITGFSAWFDAWIEWFEAGALVDKAPKFTGNGDQGNFIVFEVGGGAKQFGCDLPYGQACFAPAAWGSGESYAMGAMLMARWIYGSRQHAHEHEVNASDAVAIAAKCDPWTGGDIDVIDLQEAEERSVAA